MTPEIVTRSFSNDQFVFDKVFFENHYGLKGDKDKQRVIVDIGAHAGFFTFTALSLGARKVYCFEPYIDNFNVLLKNCYNHSFIGRVTPYQLGIYTSTFTGKFGAPNLVDGVYFDLAGIGLITQPDATFYPCPCATLNALLEIQCFNEKIDVLKINIGYAEKEILLGSNLLATNVAAVCGEVSCNDAEFLEFKKNMGLKGFINCVSKPVDANGRVTFQMSQCPLADNFIQ